MKNNEVIIDGVDVSNCVMLNDDNPENGLSECGYICKGTSCKYKSKILKQELKAKTLECKKLKSALEETIKVLQKCVDCASKNHYSCGTCGRYDLLQKIKKIVKEQE